MKVFSIRADNQVVVLSSEQQVSEEAAAGQFRNREELAKLAQDWPIARLVEVWNGLPGVKPVRKFENRGTAVRRIWKAMERLGASVAKPF